MTSFRFTVYFDIDLFFQSKKPKWISTKSITEKRSIVCLRISFSTFSFNSMEKRDVYLLNNINHIIATDIFVRMILQTELENM